jgi:pilus assembly protein CpaE
MQENSFWISLKVKNPTTRFKLEEIIRCDGDFQIQRPGQPQRPDILIFEVEYNFKNDFQIIESLLNSDRVGEVFLTSDNKDPEMLLKAIRAGTKEFFSQPIKKMEVERALEEFKKRRLRFSNKEHCKLGQIITVLGAKGGVGTTTVAVNLAACLARNGAHQSVVLIDMNAVLGEISLFFAAKPNYHWGEITRNVNRLDETFLMNVLSKHSSGLYFLSSPGYLDGYPELTSDTIYCLLSMMQKMFDFVVLDGGQHPYGAYLKEIEMSHKVLLVLILSLPCLSNTNKLLKSYMKLGIIQGDRIEVVVNRFLRKSTISISDAEDSINKKIFWSIPNDYKTTMSAINQGKVLYQISKKNAVTKSITELSDFLLNGKDGKRKKRVNFLKRA